MEYIAHIRKRDKAEQTVSEHCVNVAHIAAEYGKLIGMRNILFAAGLYHDVGKMTERFDKYIRAISTEKRGDIDHCFAGAKYVLEVSEKLGEDYKEVARFIGHIIMSHHGVHDWIDENCKDYFLDRINRGKDFDEIRRNINGIISKDGLIDILKAAKKEHDTLINECKELAGKTCLDTGGSSKSLVYRFYLGMMEKMAVSILIDADRTDTKEFMEDNFKEKTYSSDVFNEMALNMENKLKGYRRLNDRIALQRQSISDRCLEAAKKENRISRLIVPTGGGKTLSSLRYAINYCKNFDKDRIFYIAPYMSILEQNSECIEEIVKKTNFLEHHSDVICSIETQEELDEYELLAERWNYPVVATTMVKFLNALFSGKGSDVRRMHQLNNSVIIIDEVQSIPKKCIYIFNLAMNYLSYCCGSNIILCSATQPCFESLKYPLIIDSKNKSLSGDYVEDFEAFKRTKIEILDTTYGYTTSEIANFVTEKYKEEKNVLVIMNTKATALEVYKYVTECVSDFDEEPYVIHLSTSMCPIHRKEKINEMKHHLKNGEPVICVTTQLIEAGVDISFNCVVRSLAGLDSIAQAAGRCNRNGEIEEGKVYVVKVKNENLRNLLEIKEGGIATERLKGIYDNYLDVEAMRAFYSEIFRQNDRKMKYPVGSDEILDWLSENIKRKPMMTPNEKKEVKYQCQAFKSAGKNFRVIDNNATDVIVPYDDDAEEIIEKLNGNVDISEYGFYLKMAQKYTISIYNCSQNDEIVELKSGAKMLKKQYYNKEYGHDSNGGLMDLYIQ